MCGKHRSYDADGVYVLYVQFPVCMHMKFQGFEPHLPQYTWFHRCPIFGLPKSIYCNTHVLVRNYIWNPTTYWAAQTPSKIILLRTKPWKVPKLFLEFYSWPIIRKITSCSRWHIRIRILLMRDVRCLSACCSNVWSACCTCTFNMNIYCCQRPVCQSLHGSVDWPYVNTYIVRVFWV